MSSSERNCDGSPTPPAATTGSCKSATSSSSARASREPVCPPASRFTATSPSTPPSRPLSAHFRSVTSWYTTPPAACTRSHTQRGLPSEVRKNRTPSSSAVSTQRTMRLWYVLLDASISALKPMGAPPLNALMCRSPSRKSYLWTYVSAIGCTMPSPPALLTAATNSGLLHGYMGPQMSGTRIWAWRVSAVSIVMAWVARGASERWRRPRCLRWRR